MPATNIAISGYLRLKTIPLLVGLTRLAVFCSVLSLCGYLSRYFFLFEQIDSFRVQYFFIAAGSLLLACLLRQWFSVALLVLVSVLHASELSQFYQPAGVPQGKTDLRVLSVNLLASNRDAGDLLDEIKTIDPDVLILQEYSVRWHKILNNALEDYSHRLHEIINSPFGIAAYSKRPYLKKHVTYFNQALFPAVDVEIQVESATVRILGIHPIPPVSPVAYSMRNAYLHKVAEFAGGVDGALVVMGDFNTTPWSWYFSQLLKAGGLVSSRDGRGLHPTWPAGFWPLWTPIDHIVHNRKLQTVHFESGTSFGSDHFPVWADLTLVHH